MDKNSTFKIFIICILIFVTIVASKESFAQLAAGAPANFGVDGDVKNDYRLSGTFTAAGTHDWFKFTAGTALCFQKIRNLVHSLN